MTNMRYVLLFLRGWPTIKLPAKLLLLLSLLMLLLVRLFCVVVVVLMFLRGWKNTEFPVKLLLLLSLLMLLLSCFVLLFCCFLEDGKLRYMSNELLTTFSCVG